MTTHLPPDQSYSVETLGGRLIVHSVSETGLHVGKDTAYASLTAYPNGSHFFCERITATSKVEAPYGLTLAANALTCTDKVTLDATASAGKDDGEEDERDGKDGGTLTVYVQDMCDASAERLNFLARGGRGGNVTSATGTVGDGGKGGSIISVIQPTYVRVCDLLDQYYHRSELYPEDKADYENRVQKEDNLFVAAKRILDAGKQLSAPDSVIEEIFQPLSEELSDKKFELPTILSIKLAVSSVLNRLNDRITGQNVQLAPTIGSVRGGYAGIGINVQPDEPGKDGATGTEEQVFLKVWCPKSFAKAQMPFVHPKQCRMLLNRANIFFYMNSPQLRSHARSIYQRIIDRLSFLPLKPTDPLLIAYQNSRVMPASSIQDLGHIRTEAITRLTHLNSGTVDYNGYAPAWVPRASYTFYQKQIDRALENLGSFENAYISYHAALAKQQDLNEELKKAWDKTSEMIHSLNEDIKDLRLTVQELDWSITNSTPGVQEARDDLIRAYEREIDAITSAFTLTIPQIINAFTMISFGMSGPQGAELIYDGFNEVPGIDGYPVKKEYLLSQLRYGVSTIQEVALVLEKTIDGEYHLDEDFAFRVMAEKENLMAQLDEFSQKAFGGVKDGELRKQLEEAFDKFIEVITTRNDLIVQYNAAIQLILDKDAERQSYQKKEEDLSSRRVKNDDPDLPEITAYVEAIYQASRARVMKLLDLLLRSLNFRMLSNLDIYECAFGGSGADNPAALDKVPLSLTSIVLTNVREKIETKFGQFVEHWGSEPAKFPRNFDQDEGKKHRVGKHELEKLLSGDHEIFLTIPTVLKSSQQAGDFSGCCNVRLYRVRFNLVGLRRKGEPEPDDDAIVMFTLTHGGKETIVDRDNHAVEFDHDRVGIKYSFRLNSDETQTVLDNGNIAEANINEVGTTYAPPGPFTKWTVSMAGTEFSKLDTSCVSGAYFDFCGTNYAFK